MTIRLNEAASIMRVHENDVWRISANHMKITMSVIRSKKSAPVPQSVSCGSRVRTRMDDRLNGIGEAPKRVEDVRF